MRTIVTFQALRSIGVLVLPTLVGLGACGAADDDGHPPTEIVDRDASSTADGGAGPSDELLVHALCAAQAGWQCKVASACGCPPPSAPKSERECVEAAQRRCVTRIQQAIEGGPERIRIGARHVDGCVQAWQSERIDCGPPARASLDAACAPVLVAEVALGAACASDGLPCADGEGVCGGGSCTARPEEGAECASLGDGEAGSACRLGLLCVGGRCRRAPIEEGDACDEDEQCAPTLRCRGGRCGRTADEGEACDARVPCRGANECRNGTCAPGTPEACTEPGQPEVCGVESLCGAPPMMTCEALAALGEECSGADTCAEGAYCDPSSSRCEALPASGAPCGDDAHCAAGLACSPGTGLCAPAPVAGEPCARDPSGPGACAGGLACVQGTCGPLPLDGETCGYGAICGPGLGCVYEQRGGVCRPRRAVGEPCDNDTICADGAHCDPASDRCRADAPLGSPCMYGNECMAGATCVPGTGGALTCAPLPAEGDRCLLACAPGLACTTRRGDFQCFPTICASLQ